jgi:hypothetical protein
MAFSVAHTDATRDKAKNPFSNICALKVTCFLTATKLNRIKYVPLMVFNTPQ